MLNYVLKMLLKYKCRLLGHYISGYAYENQRPALIHSKKLFYSASVLNCLFKGTTTSGTNGVVLFHLLIKMSKTYCGVVDAYQALEIKSLTQNQKMVLLYSSILADHKFCTVPRIWVFKRQEIMTMKKTITVNFMTFSRRHGS